MTKRALIFDFFGVVCSEVAPFWLARYLSASEAIEVKSTIVEAADRGRLTEEDLFVTLGKMAGGIGAERVRQEWHALVQIDSQVVEFITQIKPSFRVALLTNSPSNFVRSILEKNDLDKLFDAIVVSSEIGRAKPDPEAYAIMLACLSLDASQAMMVDDNPSNIEGAIRVGLNAHRFTTLSGLELAVSGWH